MASDERWTWLSIRGVLASLAPIRVARTHLLHVVPAGGVAWERMLRFRDALRADPRMASEYGALKRALAARYPTDRAAYTDAKAAFVADVLGETRPSAG